MQKPAATADSAALRVHLGRKQGHNTRGNQPASNIFSIAWIRIGTVDWCPVQSIPLHLWYLIPPVAARISFPMAVSIYGQYPPKLNAAQLEYLLSNLKDWSIPHGVAVRPPPSVVTDPKGVVAVPAPVTLFPSPFPRQWFEEAKACQKACNELYSAIARDEEWLKGIVEEYDNVSSTFTVALVWFTCAVCLQSAPASSSSRNPQSFEL